MPTFIREKYGADICSADSIGGSPVVLCPLWYILRSNAEWAVTVISWVRMRKVSYLPCSMHMLSELPRSVCQEIQQVGSFETSGRAKYVITYARKLYWIFKDYCILA